MSRICSRPAYYCWVALALTLSLTPLRAADPEAIKPIAEWSGSVESEALEKVAPPFLTTKEGLSILWKVWNVKGELPKVDFDDAIVVVTTTRSSHLKVGYAVDEKYDLHVRATATSDMRPGFRYHLSVVDRGGLATVNGSPLPSLSSSSGPSSAIAKRYYPETELRGSLRLEGSVTMSHLLELWAGGFQKYHPQLKISVSSAGSETANPEFSEGKAVLAFMSRPVGDDELASWGKKVNSRLMSFPICEDDIALIVHKDNPVKQFSMDHLKSVFGQTKEKATWGDLGLTDDWVKKPVTLHGRDTNSGTRFHLRRVILGESEDAVAKEHRSYSSIVKAVSADPAAVGYVRDVFVRDTVRAVPVATKDIVQPYIRRTCNIVVSVPEGKALPPLVKEFLIYAYRAEGQTQLFQDGFHALGRDVTNVQLERLGLDEIK